jgi:drug/metabolite transporter (DMT)-like permease
MHWPSIVLYMTSSFMIVIFNKIILTQFRFPSVPFLMFWQSFVSTIFFYYKLEQRANRKLILVCLLNVANIFFGLNAAGTLNIAMFTALRRISIMMTLIAQWWFLKKKSTPSWYLAHLWLRPTI